MPVFIGEIQTSKFGFETKNLKNSMGKSKEGNLISKFLRKDLTLSDSITFVDLKSRI